MGSKTISNLKIWSNAYGRGYLWASYMFGQWNLWTYHLKFKMNNGLVFTKTQPWTYYQYFVFQTISKLSIQCNKGYWSYLVRFKPLRLEYIQSYFNCTIIGMILLEPLGDWSYVPNWDQKGWIYNILWTSQRPKVWPKIVEMEWTSKNNKIQH